MQALVGIKAQDQMIKVRALIWKLGHNIDLILLDSKVQTLAGPAHCMLWPGMCCCMCWKIINNRRSHFILHVSKVQPSHFTSQYNTLIPKTHIPDLFSKLRLMKAVRVRVSKWDSTAWCLRFDPQAADALSTASGLTSPPLMAVFLLLSHTRRADMVMG